MIGLCHNEYCAWRPFCDNLLMPTQGSLECISWRILSHCVCASPTTKQRNSSWAFRVSAPASLRVVFRSSLIMESISFCSSFLAFVSPSLGALRSSSHCFLTSEMVPYAFQISWMVPFCSRRRLMAMTLTRYSSLFPWQKADIWKLVPSGNLTLICLVSLFSCRLIGGTYGIGVRRVRPLGRDLWVTLMANCQRGVSRRRHLNGLFGGTRRISCSQLAGNFAEGKILNPSIESFVGFPNKGGGLVSSALEKILQQTQFLHRERGFDIKVSRVWNFTSLGLPCSKYLANLAKSLPNKIPTKFHLLRKFPQISICSGLRLDLDSSGILPCVWCRTKWHHTLQSGNPAC